MDKIEVYTFEKVDGQPFTDWTTQDACAARAFGHEHCCNVISNAFEYADREPVSNWQFATDEESTTKAEAVEGCYYGDENVCYGALWECNTCGEEYCHEHTHTTSLGVEVECVACEGTRKEGEEKAKEESSN